MADLLAVTIYVSVAIAVYARGVETNSGRIWSFFSAITWPLAVGPVLVELLSRLDAKPAVPTPGEDEKNED